MLYSCIYYGNSGRQRVNVLPLHQCTRICFLGTIWPRRVGSGRAGFYTVPLPVVITIHDTWYDKLSLISVWSTQLVAMQTVKI